MTQSRTEPQLKTKTRWWGYNYRCLVCASVCVRFAFWSGPVHCDQEVLKGQKPRGFFILKEANNHRAPLPFSISHGPFIPNPSLTGLKIAFSFRSFSKLHVCSIFFLPLSPLVKSCPCLFLRLLFHFQLDFSSKLFFLSLSCASPSSSPSVFNHSFECRSCGLSPAEVEK